jgi:hypothetical protein
MQRLMEIDFFVCNPVARKAPINNSSPQSPEITAPIAETASSVGSCKAQIGCLSVIPLPIEMALFVEGPIIAQRFRKTTRPDYCQHSCQLYLYDKSLCTQVWYPRLQPVSKNSSDHCHDSTSNHDAYVHGTMVLVASHQLTVLLSA